MTAGYWEPITSSIDFCEPNFRLTPYIAEPHNVWSSLLGLCWPGLVGILVGNPVREWRFALCHSIMLLIGLGSASLHATLHWFWQSSDELPMLYLILAYLYTAAETDALDLIVAQPERKAPLPRPWLLRIMWMIAIVNTLQYFAFQHLYWVFLSTFGTGVTILIVLLLRLLWMAPRRRHPVAHFFAATALASFLLVGMPVWIFDMLLCQEWVRPVADNLRGLWHGLTPHVLWHAAAGYGGYAAAQFLLCCRLDALSQSYQLGWWGGLPILVLVQEDANKKQKSP